MFSGAPLPPPNVCIKTRRLIVGGGVAGVTAAYVNRKEDMVLCELGQSLGGSSVAGQSMNAAFSQGAHYDLEYPGDWGLEVMALFEELGIVEFNALRDAFEFVDSQFLVAPGQESRCWGGNHWREDVMPDDPDLDELESLLKPFRCGMRLPTRMIPPAYRELDRCSFREFLEKNNMLGNADVCAALDYAMRDDYGAASDVVSALAGIHYYACRPYFDRAVRVFSPPRGNSYFVDKMAAFLPQDRVWCSHVVLRIVPQKKGFDVLVMDLVTSETKRIEADSIVYCGQKPGLKYVLPEEYRLFSHVGYAPWVVLNFRLNLRPQSGFWQNEALGVHPFFMGVVNSNAQTGDSPPVLSAYFVLPEDLRHMLLSWRRDPQPLVRETLDLIDLVIGESMEENVLGVNIKFHGHGMPIPRPGTLFCDQNRRRSYRRLVFAGVDNARLPLLVEAVDSALVAERLLAEEDGGRA